MSDYFARRTAEVQDTLDAIDTATAPCCWCCGQALTGDEPSDLFCSTTCHNRALRWTADPAVITVDPVDAIEWRGATTPAQTTKRARYRAHFQTGGVSFRHAYLDRPILHENNPCSTTPALGATPRFVAIDEAGPDGEAMRTAFRAMADGLSRFFDQFADTLSDMQPLIEALTADSQQYNRHVRLPPDDPRRAILHHVQHRNTGPSDAPFRHRGR